MTARVWACTLVACAVSLGVMTLLGLWSIWAEVAFLPCTLALGSLAWVVGTGWDERRAARLRRERSHG